MNPHEQDIHDKLSTYDPYGQMSLLFAGIVSTDTRDTFRYNDSVRIAYFEEKYQYPLSDTVKSFVSERLAAHRGDRLRCIYKKMDRDVLIGTVQKEIFNLYQQQARKMLNNVPDKGR
ncbi:MAG: hypothetical protein IKS41_06940 [Alphaproteobacteria bacterium]|nr:hypothetical protein [Alphaproteobacteria bacterium]